MPNRQSAAKIDTNKNQIVPSQGFGICSLNHAAQINQSIQPVRSLNINPSDSLNAAHTKSDLTNKIIDLSRRQMIYLSYILA